MLLARQKVLVPFMLLPSIFLFRGKSNELNSYRAQFQRKSGIKLNNKNFTVKMISVSIKTHDQVKLSGVELQTNMNSAKPASEQRWVLWLNPNGVAFEAILQFLGQYAEQTNVNILAFNYR